MFFYGARLFITVDVFIAGQIRVWWLCSRVLAMLSYGTRAREGEEKDEERVGLRGDKRIGRRS